jgi:CDP-diacylglycerol--glycerol-3-phosphate 3-phosphatidyltransferase
MESNEQQSPARPGDNEPADASKRIWTIPNALCFARLAGCPVLLVLAWREQPRPFVIMLLVLITTDWIDGRLARWLRQRSEIGPWLDTIADVALFSTLLLGGVILEHERLLENWPWLVSPLLSYMISSVVSLVRFRRLPSYHTRIAKLSSYLVIFGSVLLILRVDVWLFRIAMAAVTLGNLEAIGITLVLPSLRTDVPSLPAALRLREKELGPGEP